MNKHQKQKSREIKDIMRTDVWRKMSYKEAKRKWKNGMRALPITVIAAGAARRGVRSEITYIPILDAHEVRFVGYTGTGGRFGCSVKIDNRVLRDHYGSRTDIAMKILNYLDREMCVLVGYAPLGPVSHFGGL